MKSAVLKNYCVATLVIFLGLFANSAWSAVFDPESYEAFEVDYDSNGIDDILLKVHSSGPSYLYPYHGFLLPLKAKEENFIVLKGLENGEYEIVAPASNAIIETLSLKQLNHHVYLKDLNGDSKKDFLFQAKNSDHPSFFFYSPDSLETANIDGYLNKNQLGIEPDAVNAQWVFEDINADGRMDIKIYAKQSNMNLAATLESQGHSFAVTANQVGGLAVVGNEVGVVSGSYEVTASGGFNYSIPLTVPPGINGLQPNISFNFNSQAGNGVMGMGWSFTNPSTISRCQLTWVNDSTAGPIDYSGDAMCIDGSPLRRVNHLSTSEWVTRTEGDIRKIEYDENQETWRIYKKDGSLWFYGESGAERLYRTSGVAYSATDPGPAFSWTISSITDVFGNQIQYEYQTDHEKGTQNLSSIQYNSYKIQFNYNDSNEDLRKDKRPVYLAVGGPRLSQPDRLDGVQVLYVNGVEESQISAYEFRYGEDEVERPVLLGVTQCGADAGHCVPETTFHWNWVEHGYEKTTPGFASDIHDFMIRNQSFSTSPDPDTQGHNLSRFKMGDFNGDGLSDVYWVAGESAPTLGSNDRVDPSSIQPTQDKIYLNQGDGTYEVINGLMNTATGAPDVIWQSSHDDGPDISRGYFAHLVNRIILSDFNGDGITDIYLWGDGNSIQYQQTGYANGMVSIAQDSLPTHHETGHIYLTQEDGSFQKAGEINIPLYNAVDISLLRTGDFNGDAITDLLYLGDEAKNEPMRIYFIDEHGQPTIKEYNQILVTGDADNRPFDISRVKLGDFNGDGITDIYVIRREVGEHNHQAEEDQHDFIMTFLYTGSYYPQFVQGVSYSLSTEYPKFHTDVSRFKVTDLNGDGMSDVYFVRGTGGTSQRDDIFLSKGDGSFEAFLGKGADTFVNAGDEYENLAYSSLKFADMNGDGMVDLYKVEGWHTETADKIYYNYFNGEDFFYTSPVNNLVTWVRGDRYYAANDYQSIIFADFDGDAQLDIYQLPINSMSASKESTGHTYLSKRERKQLTKVVNGYGSVIEIDYGVLTDPEVYTFETQTNTYPEIRTRQPLQVVTALKTDSGIDSPDGNAILNDTTYEYGGYAIHLRGHGSLGFASFIKHEHFSQPEPTGGDQTFTLSTHSTYSQDYGNKESGLPVQVDTYLNHTQLLSRTKATYVYSNNGGAPRSYITQPDVKSTWAWHLDGSFKSLEIKKNTYDFDQVTEETQCTTAQNLLNGGSQSGMPSCDGVDAYQETNTYTYYPSSDYQHTYLDGTQLPIRELVHRKTTSYSVPQSLTLPSYAARSTTRVTEHAYYNGTGALESETREPDLDDYYLKTSYLYNSHGLLRQTRITSRTRIDENTFIGEENGTSSTEYDELGNIKFKINSEDHRKDYFYEDNRFPWLVTKSTDIGGLESNFFYDDMGRQYQVTDPLNISTTSTQDWCGQTGCNNLTGAVYFTKTSRTESPDAYQYFDRLGRNIGTRTQTFGGDVYTYTIFDQRGQAHITSDKHFINQSNESLSFYDESGRLTETHLPDDTKTSITYQGFETITRDPNHYGLTSFTRKSVENIIGQTVRVDDVESRSLTYTYDVQGNLVQTQDPVGNIIETEFNHLSQKVRMKDPDSGEWTYKYDNMGRLKHQKDAEGLITEMRYDHLGRIVKRTDYDKEYLLFFQKTVTEWIYDTKVEGALSTVVTNGYRQEYFYDIYNRQNRTVTLQGDHAHMFKGDDLATALSKIETAYGAAIVNALHRIETKQTYDSRGRLASVTHPYDVPPTSETIPEGLFTETFEYDELSTLTKKLVLAKCFGS